MHIVINGGGKIGSYLAATLIGNGHSVAVIEINHEKAVKLAKDLPYPALVIEGDGCDSAMQVDAGTEDADIFVATTGRDDDNLVSCQLAKTICGVPRIIGRVNNPRNERIFRRMGIECVSSTTIIAELIEREAMAGTITAMSNLRNNDVCMIEMRIPGGGDLTAERGIKLRDVALPKGSLVAAVEKNGELEIARPEMSVYPGDDVILLSKFDIADEVREYIRNL